MEQLGLALLAALVWGLKHATDPDHLTALSTLALSDRRLGVRRTGLLGLSWGVGHGVTLLLLGLPMVFVGRLLPASWQRAAEALVGLVIVGLAVRLLVRWARGYFHVHPHEHPEQGVVHAHPHFHETALETAHETSPHGHRHGPGESSRWTRSPSVSLGLGMLHGVGGTAGVTVLLIAAWPDPARAALGLVVFGLGTALAMSAASVAFGWALTRRGVVRRLEQAIPWVGAASGLFGAWYAAAAVWL